MTHPLDNPAWQALTSEQRAFGHHLGDAARYHADVSPIAAVGSSSNGYQDLARITQQGEIVAVFDNGAEMGDQWQLMAQVPLTQWTCTEPIAGEKPDQVETVELRQSVAGQMFDLARTADPGPFESRTYELGAYVGIFEGTRLVAMAGERMCFAGYREVSAVATLPGYEGRGYARALVAEIVHRQFEAGAVPFLHVRVGSPAEAAATRVYGKLGFTLREKFTMNVLRRA